jgi:hypothetical protein
VSIDWSVRRSTPALAIADGTGTAEAPAIEDAAGAVGPAEQATRLETTAKAAPATTARGSLASGHHTIWSAPVDRMLNATE